MERLLRAAVAALLAASSLALIIGGTEPAARISPELVALLRAPSTDRIHVFVHAATTDAASVATARAGLRLINRFERVGAVSAVGSPDAVRAVTEQRGVTYV